jgi:group I intron endonuclease
MSGCIYLITNTHNGHKYVGQFKGTNPEKRFKEHICSSKKGSRSILHNSMRKYGYESFKIETLCNCPYASLNNLEAYYAEIYGTYIWDIPGGYNMVWCGGASFARIGAKLNDETKLKISKKAKGRIITQEQRAKISETLTGRIGNKKTDEQRKKASERMKGYVFTTEIRKKISDTKKSQNLKDVNKIAYGSSLLSEEQCNEILNKRKEVGATKLATLYGVSRGHIYHIFNKS